MRILPLLALLACTHHPAAGPAVLRLDTTGMASQAIPALPGSQWLPILRAGDLVGGVPFGGDPAGQPDGTDANTVHTRGDRTFLVTHFERAAGAIYVSELQPADGGFRAVSTRRVDDGLESVYNPCAAATSLWGTHLGSEEYEPDAGALESDGRMRTPVDRGWGLEEEADNGWNTRVGALPAASTPYRHGWATEVAVGPDGATTFARRLAVGRFSHEQAVSVTPRVVYYSDDQAHGGGLFRFTADADGDLRAGTLEAAAWSPGGPDGRLGTLTWIDLGHTSEAELLPSWTHPPAFTDLFDRTAPNGDRCDAGRLVETGSGRECLTVRAGMEGLAARFETRRYAALRGATTMFPKEEGLAWDPAAGVLYVAWSKMPEISASRLGVEPNRCGRVVSVELATGAVRRVLDGVPAGTDGCAPEAIANPDNLAWSAGTNTLFVAEDGPTRGGRNRLWALRDGALSPLLESPPNAEVSGLNVATIAGRAWLTVSIQDDAAPSVVGFVGPLSR